MGEHAEGAGGLPGDVPEAQPEVPAVPETAEVPVRRRGRTALLIAGAVVLGLVAGTCTGYLIQADREPTKLPSLSQPTMLQAKGPAPEPLSAARDRQVKTDGDLRKLLLTKPKGTKDADWLADDGWMDLAAYADSYEKPKEIFGDLVGDEFRRAAVTGWKEGSAYTVELRLVQFRQEQSVAAADYCDNNQYWAEHEESTDSWPVAGTGTGMAYVHHKPHTEAGYLPVYSAEAHAWRGDIAVEIWVYGSKSVSKKKIMDLAERQMERL
ncbi:hypothetical protein ACIBVL_38610 [Streptomyces sp. NPDC049687]|uniref:hypothetical protein n=1 Tax=Streptomyces sp. NPDC049687 TaxID=3365596 RepID=UPI0037A5F060